MQISFVILIIANAILFVILPLGLTCCSKNNKFLKIFKASLVSTYILELVVLTMFRVELGYNIEIMADFSGKWCSKEIWIFEKFNIIDIVVNLTMLIPLGIFIYDCNSNRKSNILRALIYGSCVGFVIELMQFILPVFRIVQIQDLIFNIISVILGTVITMLIRRLLIRRKREE